MSIAPSERCKTYRKSCRGPPHSFAMMIPSGIQQDKNSGDPMQHAGGQGIGGSRLHAGGANGCSAANSIALPPAEYCLLAWNVILLQAVLSKLEREAVVAAARGRRGEHQSSHDNRQRDPHRHGYSSALSGFPRSRSTRAGFIPSHAARSREGADHGGPPLPLQRSSCQMISRYQPFLL